MRSDYRGAVRPPFIEAPSFTSFTRLVIAIGGQSAPPSLKQRPAVPLLLPRRPIGGQSAPPSLKP